MTQEEAENEADKMPVVDGKALYNKSEKEFQDRLGEAGVQIYRDLYESGYGYVRKNSSSIPSLFETSY
jgi:hypothetical protein